MGRCCDILGTYLNAKARAWHSLWSPSTLDQDEVFCAFKQISDAAEDAPFSRYLCRRHPRSSARAKAGLGMGSLSPVDFERLPDETPAEIAFLFEPLERHLRWPGQAPS